MNPKGVVVITEGDPLLDKILSSKWNGRIVRVGIDLLSDKRHKQLTSLGEYESNL